MEKSLSDKVFEFFDWLEEMTDFGDWDVNIRINVRRKLIEILTNK